MPRYDWECEAGHITEQSFPMADKPAEIACPVCNRKAASLLNAPKIVFERNREWVFDPKKNVPNQAWKVGRSGENQHRIYCQMMDAAKKRAHQSRRDQGRRDDEGWQHVGRMPLEMHESISEQMGDPQFMQKAAQSGELKQILKKTDCYLGDD